MDSSLPLLSKERNRIHVMAAGVDGVHPTPLMLSGRRAPGAEASVPVDCTSLGPLLSSGPIAIALPPTQPGWSQFCLEQPW